MFLLAQYKFSSLTTSEFKEYFLNYFSKTEAVKQIDWNAWLTKPGMPIVTNQFDQTLSNASKKLAEKYVSIQVTI
jgi:hypothetical protein